MATLLALALIYPVIFAFTRAPAFVVASMFPLAVVFAAVLNALLVVEEAGSMTSGYPRSMLTLPVRTRTLVLWPMLIASLVPALLWLATATLVYGASGFQIPVLLPSLALVALMAWIQALAWMPLVGAWLRAIVIPVLILALGAMPYRLAVVDGNATAATAVLVLIIAAAVPTALLAVASERRGDSWTIGTLSPRPSRAATARAQSRSWQPYRSSAAAQFAYEWNCHGLILPISALNMAFWVVLLALGGPGRADFFAFPFALGTLVGLPVLSAFAGSQFGLGRLRPFWVIEKGFITFLSSRPISTGALVAAKFRMAAASVLLTWAIDLVVVAFYVVASGHTTTVWELTRAFFDRYSAARGVAILALGSVLLPALTWRLLTDGFALVLTGRRWIAEGWAYLWLGAFFVMMGAVVWFAQHPKELPRLIAVIPWLVACGATLKLAIAVAAFRLALSRDLIDRRFVGGVVGVWAVVTACAIVMALLALPEGALPVPKLVILTGIAMLVPLVRFPLATLAVDWNRHR
jgi:hypothetical protein